jgi:ABC-2 type transport system ATP-binding protein
VQRRGDQVTVTGAGAGAVLNAVTTLLARRGLVPRQLRVDQASLEDAFVALTGRPHDEKTTDTQESSDVR